LAFFSNEYVLGFIEANAKLVLPIILQSLIEASNYHWSPDVKTLATSVVENFVSAQPALFQEIIAELKKKKLYIEQTQAIREKHWQKIEKQAKSNDLFVKYKKVK